MYKWKVEYVLKNGEHLFGEYFGDEVDTAGVAGVLLSGDPNTFNSCKTKDGKGTMLVRNDDIAALVISL